MPRYGANMEEGTVGQWLVSEGDEVSEGQVICEIEIEKLANDFEAPEDGVLRKILCDEGDSRECGAPIAIIAEADEDISALEAEAESGEISANIDKTAPKEEPGDADTAAETVPAEKNAAKGPVRGTPGQGMTITPKALKLAEEKGVDYSGITGTGIHGAITRQDVKDFIAPGGGQTAGSGRAAAARGTGPKVAAPGTSAPMSTARRVTAEYMMKSLETTAQASIAADGDVTELVDRYRAAKEGFAEKSIKLSYTALIVKAMAAALVEHSLIRTTAEGNTLRTAEEINIGVGVDAEYGLIVPVIQHADKKSLGEVCGDLVRLSDKARAGSLGPEETKNGTITLSNLGMFGVRYSTPILNPGESAIVGAGTLTQQPVILDGGIYSRWIISLSMTFDHRVIDGAPAARYLQAVIGYLNGEKIW